MMSCVYSPVPCISGQAGMPIGPATVTICRTVSASASALRTIGFIWPTRLRNRSSWRHITPLGMPVVPPV